MPNLKLNDNIISQLAREVARNIYPMSTLREQFKLTVEEFDEAVETPYFHTRLAEEASIWNDPSNVKTRLKLKFGTLIEESLPELYRLLHDPLQPMAAKVAALQMAVRYTDDNPNVRENGEAGVNKVRITINIDGKAISYDKQQAEPRVIEGDVITVDGKSA